MLCYTKMSCVRECLVGMVASVGFPTSVPDLTRGGGRNPRNWNRDTRREMYKREAVSGLLV